jgi:hypothetical protein
MCSTAMKLEEIREIVAAELEARGIGDRAFYEEIREGRRDHTPFMIGALAVVQRGELTTTA